MASVVVSVTVAVFATPASTLLGDTETVDSERLGVTVMVGAVDVRGVPSMLAVMVLVPGTVPVKVAV